MGDLSAAHAANRAHGQRRIADCMRVVLWAQRLRRFPSPRDIVDRWDCSYATAYRYRNALADAMGILVPPSPAGHSVIPEHRTGKALNRRMIGSRP